MKVNIRISGANQSFFRLIIFLLVIAGAYVYSSCSKDTSPVPEVKKSSEKSITNFGFAKADNPVLSQDYSGIVSGTAVTFSMPSNSDLSSLKATFSSSAKSIVKIGGITQTDKVTSNNFSSPVTYTVVAEDGSTQTYTVTIQFSDKAILSYGFAKGDNASLSEDCIATINGTTIYALVSSGADLTTLKASFSVTPKATVKIGDVVQQSKITGNNFLQSVVYSVVAEDGTKQDYTVTVTKKSSAKSFLTFGLNMADNPTLPANCTGVISGSTIKVLVPYNTSLSSFKATFTISPKASIKIGTTDQHDKVSINNFTSPVVYTIIAEDGSTMNYTVTVSCALNQAKELLTFSFQKIKNGSLLYDLTGLIDQSGKKVTCILPAGVSKTNLIATFSISDKASAKVDQTVQQSGINSNNYSSNLTFTVVAEDGTTNAYVIQLLDEVLPDIVQSRIDNKIVALNLHKYPNWPTELFKGVQVVPLYSNTFLSQKPSSSMPFDAGYIGSDGKIYVTTPFTAAQKAVFKDATHAAIYYMCQLFIAHYYNRISFPIWFKFGFAAFEAGLTITDEMVKTAILNYGGQLPSFTTLNDPALFSTYNGISIAYLWGEFMGVDQCWYYSDLSDFTTQNITPANWAVFGSMENLTSIWTRYFNFRILESNDLKRGRVQGETAHFRFLCAGKDVFCIPGFTDILEHAYTEFTSLFSITFPEKISFLFAPECERDALLGWGPCRGWYTSGTGWVSGLHCSSPSTLTDMPIWNSFLRHEFAHVVVQRLYPNFQPTAWLNEGAADFINMGLLDQKAINNLKPMVQDAMKIATNYFGHRPNYEDTKVYPGNPYYDYYLLGRTLTEFIYQKGGYAGVKNVLTDAENGYKLLGFANHDDFMNGYYVYYDAVWSK